MGFTGLLIYKINTKRYQTLTNDEISEYERQLALKYLHKIKMILLHDRLLHLAVLLFVIGLSSALYMQYVIGSTGLDQGTVLVEDTEKTILKNENKVYSVAFTEDHNAFAFVSFEKVNIYLLDGNYTGSTNITTVLDNSFKVETKTKSWGYFFNEPATFTIVIENTNNKDILYSITVRDYTNAEYQKIANRSIGGILLYASFLPLIFYVLIRVFKKYSIIPIFLTLLAFLGFLQNKYDKENRKTESEPKRKFWNRR